MIVRHFHGSSEEIVGPLRAGTYVSTSKSNALIFARRRRKATPYIYTLLLDTESDIRSQTEAGVVDTVLVRDTPFESQIPVTEAVLAECKEEGAKLLP
jgi:hypothetical protein